MLATVESDKINYHTPDHLGSPRVLTDAAGAIISRRDFFPFGESMPDSIGGRTTITGYSTPDSIKQKFTGYERDDETGLDFAQARYFSSIQGRFTSVDPVTITDSRLTDPQQINRYVYVRNNPLILIDTSGNEIKYANEESRKKLQPLVDQGDKESKTFKEGLNQFRGEGKPDITLQVGPLPGKSGDEDPITLGQTDTKINGDVDTNGILQNAKVVSTTVTIDYDKVDKVGYDQVNNLGHEIVGHGAENLKDPLKYGQDLLDDKKNKNKTNAKARENKAQQIEKTIKKEREEFKKQEKQEKKEKESKKK